MTSQPGLDAAEVFRTLDRKDADAFGRFLAPDARYHLGNNPAVVGRDQIVAGTAAFLASLESLHHELVNLWYVDGGFIAQLVSTFVRADGRTVSLPAAVISTVDGGLISEHRVHIDISPLAAQ